MKSKQDIKIIQWFSWLLRFLVLLLPFFGIWFGLKLLVPVVSPLMHFSSWEMASFFASTIGPIVTTIGIFLVSTAILAGMFGFYLPKAIAIIFPVPAEDIQTRFRFGRFDSAIRRIPDLSRKLVIGARNVCGLCGLLAIFLSLFFFGALTDRNERLSLMPLIQTYRACGSSCHSLADSNGFTESHGQPVISGKVLILDNRPADMPGFDLDSGSTQSDALNSLRSQHDYPKISSLCDNLPSDMLAHSPEEAKTIILIDWGRQHAFTYSGSAVAAYRISCRLTVINRSQKEVWPATIELLGDSPPSEVTIKKWETSVHGPWPTSEILKFVESLPRADKT